MNQVIRDYLAELKASPVKTGVIGLLLAFGLLLWGRLLLKDVPRTASADDPVAAAVAANLGVNANGDPPNTIRLAEPPPLERDLFGLDPTRYRRTSDSEEPASGEKLGPGATEDSVQAAVVSAARQLRLTSFIEAEEPVVMINNRPLRRGDTIDGFTVLAIQGRSVVLENQGVKVRLSL
ncbi:MAG: general secretion pathway protein GspB [Planctomycetota bacterium]